MIGMFDHYSIETNIKLGPYQETYEVNFDCSLGSPAILTGHPDNIEPAIAPQVKVLAIYDSKYFIIDKVDSAHFYKEAEKKIVEMIFDGKFDYLES